MKKKTMIGKTVEYWPTINHKLKNWEKDGIDPATVRRKGIVCDQWKDYNDRKNYLVQPEDEPAEIITVENLHRVILVALFIGLALWAII